MEPKFDYAVVDLRNFGLNYRLVESLINIPLTERRKYLWSYFYNLTNDNSAEFYFGDYFYKRELDHLDLRTKRFCDTLRSPFIRYMRDSNDQNFGSTYYVKDQVFYSYIGNHEPNFINLYYNHDANCIKQYSEPYILDEKEEFYDYETGEFEIFIGAEKERNIANEYFLSEEFIKWRNEYIESKINSLKIVVLDHHGSDTLIDKIYEETNDSYYYKLNGISRINLIEGNFSDDRINPIGELNVVNNLDNLNEIENNTGCISDFNNQQIYSNSISNFGDIRSLDEATINIPEHNYFIDYINSNSQLGLTFIWLIFGIFLYFSSSFLKESFYYSISSDIYQWWYHKSNWWFNPFVYTNLDNRLGILYDYLGYFRYITKGYNLDVLINILKAYIAETVMNLEFFVRYIIYDDFNLIKNITLPLSYLSKSLLFENFSQNYIDFIDISNIFIGFYIKIPIQINENISTNIFLLFQEPTINSIFNSEILNIVEFL